MTQHCGLLRTEQGGPHIHVAAPSIATILDNLATVLGEYHAVLDLTDAFFFLFSIALTAVTQQSLYLTWERQQWTLQWLTKATCTASQYVIG